MVSDLSEITETHTSCNLSGAGERQDLVLACCVMLEQLDQGFRSTDGSRSFSSIVWQLKRNSIHSPHRELEGWLAPGHLRKSATQLQWRAARRLVLGLSRAAVTDRQQGAEDLLWLLEKQQQQQGSTGKQPCQHV